MYFPGIHVRRDTGSCPCALRLNTTGSPADRHKGKKVWMRGGSWPPSGPLTPGDALQAGRAGARHPAGLLLLLFPTTTVCSYPRWLGPRRHAKQEHLPEGEQSALWADLWTINPFLRDRLVVRLRQTCRV